MVLQTQVRLVIALSLALIGGVDPAARLEAMSDGPVGAVAGRVWHVAPKTLSGLPSDVQVRTISEAVTNAGPGDLVVIHEGVYREAVVDQ